MTGALTGAVRDATLHVLGVETSCDETSAAVVSGAPNVAAGDGAGAAPAPRPPALRSLVIYSQDVHRIFGGVVTEQVEERVGHVGLEAKRFGFVDQLQELDRVAGIGSVRGGGAPARLGGAEPVDNPAGISGRHGTMPGGPDPSRAPLPCSPS